MYKKIIATISVIAFVGIFAGNVSADVPRKLYFEYFPQNSRGDGDILIVQCDPGHVRVDPAGGQTVVVWCEGK
jgi:hypothetical protein